MKIDSFAALARLDSLIMGLFGSLSPEHREEFTELLDSVYEDHEALQLIRIIRQTEMKSASAYFLRCDHTNQDGKGSSLRCVLPIGHAGEHIHEDDKD